MSFFSLYQKLNREQKKAVDMIEGPIMVIAGPGTGKTRVLTLRIANILRKTDIEPENILALTFTDSGVVSMRNKLADLIGSDAYLVSIFTFHGFCNYIIQQYPEEFPLMVNFTNILEADQIRIIEEIVDSSKLEYLKPFGDPSFYVKPINVAIEKLKREGVNPKELSRTTKQEEKKFKEIPDLFNEKGILKGRYQVIQKRIQKNKELAQVYKKYQEKLQSLKLYDYNDMIMAVLNIFSKKRDFLLRIQEKYLYFLVDEHQDTNNAQNKILELLCDFHSSPNIFVVGDEKQAIYRFQGASLENFYYFQQIYPEAQVINFFQNYRSSQLILDAADNIIPSKLKSNNNFKEKISLNIFQDSFSEDYFLARNIKKKGKIAVLARENKDLVALARTLKKEGIDFSLDSDQNILTDVDIKKIILLLKLINNFDSWNLFFEALHIDFLKIDPLEIYQKPESKKIKDFRRLIGSLVIDSKNSTLPDFFERLIKETGFLAYVLKDEERLEKVNAFFNEVKSFFEKNKKKGLKDFLAYLDLLERYNILIKKSFSRDKEIKLMTAHRAKGLEFDYVYIIKAIDGIWGNKRYSQPLKLSPNLFSLTGREIEEQEPNDDERRLFYVALTRAKRKVFITFFKRSIDQREKLPSLFLKDFKKDFLEVKENKKIQKDLFSFKESPKNSFKDKKLISDLFYKRGLSVTGLNNYLSCPWKYFYVSLLKIPKAQENHQMYGTAVHEALKDFFDKKGDKRFLLERFAYHLKREPMAKNDLERFLKRGKLALGRYYHQKHNFNVVTEFNVSSLLPSSKIKIQGKIDKIEFLKDGVKIIDYKTGKPKSRNFIEGKIKNSEGDIKRQLIFYKLLLNNYKKGKYKMTVGEIDFVEPTESNNFKKESFFITEKEVKEIEKLVKKTSQEILDLSFWQKRCDDKNCHFCALREMTE